MKSILYRLTAVAVVAVLAACGGGDDDDEAETEAATPDASPIEQAVEDANLRPDDEQFVTVADGGRTLIIDGESADSANRFMPNRVQDGLTIAASARLLSALDMPQSISARMSGTRALDGTQTGEWGDFSATWTYHPDDGLDIVVVEA
jgi:hypothetical protein